MPDNSNLRGVGGQFGVENCRQYRDNYVTAPGWRE